MSIAVSVDTKKRKTRAEILKDKVQIRLAIDGCGPMIEQLLKENGIEYPDADWAHIFPHWLIAIVDDDVIGCVMVTLSKPFGSLQFMFVKPSVSFKLRAIAIRKLYLQGISALMLAGCSYMTGAVDKKNQKFADILSRHGVVKIADADMVAKRLITGRMQ